MKKLEKILDYIRDCQQAFFYYLPSSIIVLFLYFSLLGIAQAQDILLILGEKLGNGFLLGFFAIVFFVGINWYSSRLIYIINGKTIDEENDILRTYPRFIGYHSALAIELAIISLPNLSNIDRASYFFFLGEFCLYFFLNFYFGQPRSAIKVVIASLTGAVLPPLFMLPFWNHEDPETFLGLLAFVMLIGIIKSAFIFVTHYRRRYLVKGVTLSTQKSSEPGNTLTKKILFYHERFLIRMGANPQMAGVESPFFFAYHIVISALFLIYIVTLNSPSFAITLTPFTVALLGICMLIALFNLSLTYSTRYKFRFFVVFILFAMFAYKLYDPHKVRTFESNPEDLKPIPIDSFASLWENHPCRKDEILKGDYDVYVVLNNGGATRAAAWSTGVLARLMEVDSGYFGKHLLCMAGSSGGSVGNMAFYNWLQSTGTDYEVLGQYAKLAEDLRRGDYLSYPVAWYLGPDMISTFFPFFLNISKDRAIALEQAHEYVTEEGVSGGQFYQRSFHELYDPSGRMPALFINLTQADNGKTWYWSTINLSNDKACSDTNRNLMNCLPQYYSVKNSTAAILSSRFPYVSPAGNIANLSFVDGGYSDNSGAGTALQFLIEFLQKAKHSGNLKIHVIELSNSEPTKGSEKVITPQANDLFSPLIALAGLQSGSTVSYKNAMITTFRAMKKDIKWYKVNLFAPSDTTISLPMSWMLSNHSDSIITKKLAGVNTEDVLHGSNYK